MGQKKYISQRTRTTHTYSFYRQRRNDPNWRADYLEARTQRQRHILVTLIIILALMLFGVIGYGKRATSLLDRSSQSSQSTAVENTSRQDSNTSATNQTVTSEHRSTEDTQKTVVVNNYQRYSIYSGEYGSETQTYSLDFSSGRLLTTGPQKQQIFYFDKVMVHPDKSLVINMHGNYHYNAYDGKGEHIKLVYLSVLFAPHERKITKNWQTGESIEDMTNTVVNRFSIALSNDGGKVFQMAPAYAAFATNQTAGDSLALIYSEAN
ncbi:hypothetical protein EUZ87_13040 [Lactiplantibacillus paraplantarum]|uniref:Uncharacterized protein n=1 Tax=Lactiplantibacillus paraplantarum TaxID=60520 RepID=A0A4Q9XYZ1_9LACO|nr:hypothetical protein EUZ87_13040 [Lactiplantibacillus paraplantarum]